MSNSAISVLCLVQCGVSLRSEGDLYGLKPVSNITESTAVGWGGKKRDDVASLVFPTFFKDAWSGFVFGSALCLAKSLTLSFWCGPGAFATSRWGCCSAPLIRPKLQESWLIKKDVANLIDDVVIAWGPAALSSMGISSQTEFKTLVLI